MGAPSVEECRDDGCVAVGMTTPDQKLLKVYKARKGKLLGVGAAMSEEFLKSKSSCCSIQGPWVPSAASSSHGSQPDIRGRRSADAARLPVKAHSLRLTTCRAR